MNTSGLVYVLIVLAIVITITFTNHKMRKVTNMYWFWMAIAAFCFIWVLSFRFIPDWIKYWQNHSTIYSDPSSYHNSEMISRAYLLDACPCFFAMLCVSLIADPSRRMARLLAPIALVGGLITIGSIVAKCNDNMLDSHWDAYWLFIGYGTEKCYFIMHTMQILLSVGVLLNTPKSGWRVWLVSVGAFGVYLAYVAIVMAISGCAWFTTGLSPNDYIQWTGEYQGEYHIIKDLTGFPNHLCPLVLIPLLTAFGLTIGCVLKNFVFCRWIWSYGNEKSKDWTRFWNYKKFTKKPDKAWW